MRKKKKKTSSHRTQNTPPPSPASYFPALEEEHQAVATTTQEHPSTNIAPQSLQSWGTLPPRAPPQEGPTKEPLTMPNPPSHQKKNISLEIVQNPASSTQKKNKPHSHPPHMLCTSHTSRPPPPPPYKTDPNKYKQTTTSRGINNTTGTLLHTWHPYSQEDSTPESQNYKQLKTIENRDLRALKALPHPGHHQCVPLTTRPKAWLSGQLSIPPLRGHAASFIKSQPHHCISPTGR